MAVADDIAKIIEQESELVFTGFDEHAAFDVAMIMRSQALAEGLGIICDIRFWDRPLFYFAMPRSTADNPAWAIRKSNTVRRLHKSTYRAVLESGQSEQVFPAGRNMPPAEYVLAGGGFPIRIKGVGVIGSISVSGLPQREDHSLVVATLCDYLKADKARLALGRPDVP